MGPGERSWFESCYEVEGGAQGNPQLLSGGTKLMGVPFTDVGDTSNLEEGEHHTHTFSWLYDIIYKLGSFHSAFHVNF